MAEILIRLSVEQAEVVLRALQPLPYGVAAPIVDLIHAHARDQLSPVAPPQAGPTTGA